MKFLARPLAAGSLFCAIALFIATVAPNSSAATDKEVYGTAPDGTQLHWDVFTPSGNGPWPVALVIHGGGFHMGSPRSADGCAQDLANAGYLAFSIEYRLAPPGTLTGQVSDGRYPQQSDDVKMAVRAALADARCNGQVVAVGGSAGGYHAVYNAITATKGVDRVIAAVSLSGAYDFSDFRPNPNIQQYTHDVTNYMGVDSTDTTALRAASPADLVKADVPPLFLINSQEDPMPFPQLADMTTKLDSLGVNTYQSLTLPGDAHAFDYWSSVKTPVIAFLNAVIAGSPLQRPAPTPTPPPDGPAKLVNVSTRVHVGSGDHVMIGGFIISGLGAKDLVLRALGPSLAAAGISQPLSDPVLELYDSNGRLISRNDNWSGLSQNIIDAGLQPTSAKESLISATLPAGSYTAVLSGVGAAAGDALFELYDMEPNDGTLANISTRGQVLSDTDPIIGGFITNGTEPSKVLVRALGPSLAAQGVQGALSDPVLELHNSNGSLIYSNDNWRSTQQQQISATTIPPTDDREAAIVATLAPGAYTAVVRENGSGGGIGLVEVYALPND